MRSLLRPMLALAVFAASGALAQSAAPDLSGRDPHWIKDAVSNCWAANPHPEPGETITWTGACVNGLISGPGTLTWYLNGRTEDRDEGTFARGELSGHGRISFPDGVVFEGEFPGKGVLAFPDGRKIEAQTIKEIAGWSIEPVQPAR